MDRGERRRQRHPRRARARAGDAAFQARAALLDAQRERPVERGDAPSSSDDERQSAPSDLAHEGEREVCSPAGFTHLPAAEPALRDLPQEISDLGEELGSRINAAATKSAHTAHLPTLTHAAQLPPTDFTLVPPRLSHLRARLEVLEHRTRIGRPSPPSPPASPPATGGSRAPRRTHGAQPPAAARLRRGSSTRWAAPCARPPCRARGGTGTEVDAREEVTHVRTSAATWNFAPGRNRPALRGTGARETPWYLCRSAHHAAL